MSGPGPEDTVLVDDESAGEGVEQEEGYTSAVGRHTCEGVAEKVAKRARMGEGPSNPTHEVHSIKLHLLLISLYVCFAHRRVGV